MDIIFNIVVFIVGILNIILFFKIWGMTNNVAKIKDFIIDRTSYNDIQTTKSNIQDGINESRKVTRLRDGKKMYVQYMIGDNYDCLDPQTKEELGRYTKSEIKLGW